jgi:TatD DNase family protein
MIDTHTHLYYHDFDQDLDVVITRARAEGVSKIITIAVDKFTAQRCLDIASTYRGTVFAAIGVHPSETDKVTEDDLLWIEAMAGDPSVVAIGEIGLDVYRGETNIKDQEKLFERMLALAIQTGLPAIIHHRSAGSRTLEIVKSIGLSHGVFHCFSEDIPYAKKVLDQGLCVSFTGNITYKKSFLPDVARALPLDRIFLETDCPFMAPVPYRGNRCEPAYVKEVAQKLAELHGKTFEEVDHITTTNAEEMFFLNDTMME